ncbi:NAD(P)/FAD-dependent oxidoreductase [Pannonibacter tanglangensis]|uniref:FAD-dependent oxidoreductase n=1 Tax=Pannonibacter tanglangensis TaxID=2750084 RepID=A0ABW9ZGF8_9HYPH|nr:NAD(P)/FAD-dependent oxidoreductase [Pannonibacter sp. XCT-34]NBN63783.1 FAD-dependent oxidoreductase [Pannonibacter sp. XCT-34]
MTDVQTLVIGAGVVGLASARALALAGDEVMVLERHGLIGSETSSRSSEVIHAGIYYPRDSLKARLCVAGRKALYAYAARRGIAHRRLGKLIVATDAGQAGQLDAIAAAAAANGVEDLVRLDAAAARALEPELSCTAALLSPSTGIIDSHALMLALQGDLEAAGGQVVLNTCVAAIAAVPGGYAVEIAGEGGYRLTCRRLVLSAGLGTPALLRGLAGDRLPRFGLAKGSYFRLAGRAPFSRLIYPVPVPGGLGIHLTLDLAGQARFGPDVEWIETEDYRVDPARGAAFEAAVRCYWPGLPEGALQPDYAGIRPKLGGPGDPAADFRIEGASGHGHPGLVLLMGLESPGLTSCLAIAGEVLDKINEV